MDASDYPSYMNLARMSAQLAAQNRRVAASVSHSDDPIDRLLTATVHQDWQAVVDTARQLADGSLLNLQESASRAIIDAAQEVCTAVGRAHSHGSAPPHLDKLLCACRVSRKRTQTKPRPFNQ